MKKGKAFVVVGHAHWGKSNTLKALTDERLVRWFDIGPDRFWIKRMSNDDVEDAVYELLHDLDPITKPLVILALCPTFDDPARRGRLLHALKALKAKYEIFFFVLPAKYLDQEMQISSTEKRGLQEFGKVGQLSTPKAERERRAKEFREFIATNMRA